MGFKTVQGKVVKDNRRKGGYLHTPEGYGNRSKIIIADITRGKEKGAVQLMKYKTALKSAGKYVMRRFADKEDIAQFV